MYMIEVVVVLVYDGVCGGVDVGVCGDIGV